MSRGKSDSSNLEPLNKKLLDISADGLNNERLLVLPLVLSVIVVIVALFILVCELEMFETIVKSYRETFSLFQSILSQTIYPLPFRAH